MAIITKLVGGLGNQMFQYAAGRKLSNYYGTILKLDITKFKLQPGVKRRYALSIFNIQENFATPEDIRKSANYYFQKRTVEYFPLPLNFKNSDIYLDGFWQSEKYFKDIEKTIREDFIFKELPNSYAKRWQSIIKKSNSVSVHIRMGDYARNPIENKKFGLLPLAYYHNALEIISKKAKNPEVFVFSDEISWAKAKIHFSYPTYFVSDTSPNKIDSEDMRLMSNCKHNIICNSSYSWWGAWLNQNAQKVVVAPKMWRYDGYNNPDVQVPKNWLKI